MNHGSLAFWLIYGAIGACGTAAYDYSQLKGQSGYTAMQLMGTLLQGCGVGAAWPVFGTIYFVKAAIARFQK